MTTEGPKRTRAHIFRRRSRNTRRRVRTCGHVNNDSLRSPKLRRSDPRGFYDFQGVGADGPSPVHFEPQVAVLCDAKSDTPYYSQYMSENGRWTSDTKRKVGCLKEKVDILDYCKKVSVTVNSPRRIDSQPPLLDTIWERTERVRR